MCILIFVRTPSKQKSPKKEGDIDIVDLLRGHDPKEYERILNEHGIHDYRAILQAVEFLKREKEMETGKVVRDKMADIMWWNSFYTPLKNTTCGDTADINQHCMFVYSFY